MKWNRSIMLLVILLAAATALSITQINDANNLKKQYSSVSIRFKEKGPTKASIETVLQNEKSRASIAIPEITAWMWLNETEIKNNDLNRTAKVSIELVYGNMSLANPMTLLYGNYVYPEDKKGCILDSDTAFSLYGTQKAVGNMLTYQNQNYYVRGIVKTKHPIMMLPEKDNTIAYPNLELLYQNKNQGEALARDFLVQNGFAKENVVIDGYFYGQIHHTVIVLPAWLLFISVSIILLRYLWNKRGNLKPNKVGLYFFITALIILGYGILLFGFTGNPFYLPENLLPTKFSDFDFWTNKYKEIHNQLQQMRYLIPYPKDVLLGDEISKTGLDFVEMILLNITLLQYIGRTWNVKKVKEIE